MTTDEDQGTESRALQTGYVLNDRYELREPLGEGGFAVVYLAFDRTIERKVAIKVLDPSHMSSGGESAELVRSRFLREARIAAQIRHASIVEIHDFGVLQDIDQPYMIMEFLEGTDLDEEIKQKGAIDPGRLLPLFVEALDGLGEAHDQEVVHKDLKPANLFLTDPGTRKETMKVVDFGIAHVNEQAEERLTKTGGMTGTPHYLPPEYLEEQTVRPEMDVYQMGLILIEGLTGQRVVEAETVFQAAVKHVNRQLQVPEVVLEGRLGEVIRRAIAYEPEDRYSTATEFAQDLAEIDPASLEQLSPLATSEEARRAATSETAPSEELDLQAVSARTKVSHGGMAAPTTAKDKPAADAPSQTADAITLTTLDRAFGSNAPLKILVGLFLGTLALVAVVLFLVISDADDVDEPTADPVAQQEVEPTEVDEPVAADDSDEDVDESTTREPELEIAAGEVLVESNPSESLIRSGDGTALGMTPESVQFDAPGTQTLVVEHPGYESAQVTVEVPEEGRESVEVELDRRDDADDEPTARVEPPEDPPEVVATGGDSSQEEEADDSVGEDEQEEAGEWALPGASDDDDEADEEEEEGGFRIAD